MLYNHCITTCNNCVAEREEKSVWEDGMAGAVAPHNVMRNTPCSCVRLTQSYHAIRRNKAKAKREKQKK